MVDTFGHWAAQRYRRLAEEFRAIAATMVDEHARAIYASLAADYERMAEQADERAPAARP